MKHHVRLLVLLSIISTIFLTGFTCSKRVPQPIPQENMSETPAAPATTDTTTTE